MAVEDFAPSVLALADMFKRANVLLNGERSSIRVLIDVDVEQHCFQFGIEIVQSIWEHAKDLLGEEHVKSAGNLATAIGVFVATARGVVGLMEALKRLRGRPPSETKMVVKDGSTVVQINSNGGDVFYVDRDTAKLLQDAKTIESAKKAIEPATKHGYDKIEFENKGGPKETITNEEARLIQSMPTPAPPIETVIPESIIRAQVGVRRAVYIGPGKWTIQYDKAREMTIAAEEWLADFQANKIAVPPGARLDVSILMSAIKVDARGEPIEEPEYKITKVHGVILP